jgi:hypothetical protein
MGTGEPPNQKRIRKANYYRAGDGRIKLSPRNLKVAVQQERKIP